MQDYLNPIKIPLSEHLWTVTLLKRPKDYLNLRGSKLVIFFDHSETKSVRKALF